MRKKDIVFIVLFIVLFLTMLFLSTVGSAISAELYDADVTIDDAGNMTVEERLTMNYPSGYNVIFRDIIYDKHSNAVEPYFGMNRSTLDEDSVEVKVYNKDNVLIYDSENPNSNARVGYSFNQDRDELGYLVECAPEVLSQTSKCESIFLQVYNGFDSQMTFVYKYTILGAVTQFSDISVLNWRLFDYFDSTIKAANVRVHLPEHSYTLEDDIYMFGHGLYDGEVIFESPVKVVLDIGNLRGGDFLEFRFLFPNSIVGNIGVNHIETKPMLEEILLEEAEMARAANMMRIAVLSTMVLTGLIFLVSIGVVIHVYKKYDKEFVPDYDGKYYRELVGDYSPAEMSYLYYFKKINNEDVTATLLDLVRRKYLFLEDTGDINAKDPNYTIVLNEQANLKELKEHELHLIDWFINKVGDNKKVTFHEIEKFPKENYSKAEIFQSAAKTFKGKAVREAKKHDFFDAELEKKRPKLMSYLAIPILAAVFIFFAQAIFDLNLMIYIVANGLVAVLYGIYVSTFKRRSVNGNNDYVRWKGFRNFLLEFSQMKDYPIPGIIVWEHYLVYATSLKVADKVMEQLTVKLPMDEVERSNSTYLGVGYGHRGFYYGYMFGRLNSTMNTARVNAISTISAHNAAKFSGGKGGGFSGGSSFGGGGGGFRSR